MPRMVQKYMNHEKEAEFSFGSQLCSLASLVLRLTL